MTLSFRLSTKKKINWYIWCERVGLWIKLFFKWCIKHLTL